MLGTSLNQTFPFPSLLAFAPTNIGVGFGVGGEGTANDLPDSDKTVAGVRENGYFWFYLCHISGKSIHFNSIRF